jgi:multiple sugar transport system substrate-binding protein
MKKSRKFAALRVTAVVMAMALGVAACGSSDDGDDKAVSTSGGAEGVDDGTNLTLWTRAPLEKQANLLVDAYNASHKNQVKLTVVPNDDYVAKVGAAAGSDGLPDLFAADIVYVPNWTSQGLFQDITDRYESLDFKDDINQGHVEAGKYDGKNYVLPFVLDLSVMMYNKDLYKQAGLDPEQGPTTLAEFAEQAKAVDALGGDINGTYFGGNCGGCLVFTWFPSIWAGGGDVMNADGTESNLGEAPATDVYATWKDLVDSDAVAPGAKDETGATWTAGFQEGKVGVMPYPATLLSTVDQTIDVGVVPIPGPDGGESTFVGGDGIGVSKDSKNSAQAWNFLSWLMSEDAQVGVLAKDGDVTSRGDLASNEYSEKDPRVLAINQVAAKGTTPISKNFQEAFNAPNSPWITLVRNAVFGDSDSVEADNDLINDVLGQ